MKAGFGTCVPPGVRAKHVEYLVSRWHAEEIATGTFKNRMSALRWLAEKIDKQNIVARENADYGIAERRYVTNVSKAHALDADKLAAITDPFTALSLRLQEAFGLRREESIKLRPTWAMCCSSRPVGPRAAKNATSRFQTRRNGRCWMRPSSSLGRGA